jgi:hypothetical protein
MDGMDEITKTTTEPTEITEITESTEITERECDIKGYAKRLECEGPPSLSPTSD